MAIQETLPDRLGPYRLLDRIGEGGMGLVHLAADCENRLLAVKILRPHAAGDAAARRRLAREVETMRRVRSPYVAEVIDADVTGDVPYIVTRYVPGRSLDEVITRHGPLSGVALGRLAYGLAAALAAVHGAGVVHRDLKPGNVMMTGGDPVVIDFGIAQAAGATRLTQAGMFMGTPGYLAPEVIEGQPSGPSADVHSWAATVAFAARGEPPYGTGPSAAVFFRILRGDVNLEGIHATLYPLIAAALARDPAQRPPAAWLAGQVARLDLTAHAPPPATATRSAVAPDTVTAGPAGTGNGPRAPAERVTAYQRPSEVADLLPPVRYLPPPDGGHGGRGRAGRDLAPAGRGAGGSRAVRPRWHGVLALAVLLTAVGISLVLPVAGTMAVLAVLAILRAAGRARDGLAVRRSARGPRATDPLVVAVSAPWALARAAAVTLLFAPLLLCIAAAAAVIAIIVLGISQLQLAAAYAAGAFVVLNCLGPASRAPRRELRRIFSAIAPTRLTATAATVLLGAFAVTMVWLALLKTPVFWPVPDPHGVLGHLPGARLVHGGILRHLGHGLARQFPVL